MRAQLLTDTDAHEAASAINAREATVASWARDKGVSRTAVYNAIKREQLTLDLNICAQEHIALQRVSDVPPEVYAFRAAVPISTLRRWAGEQGLPIAMSGYAEKKAWWEKTLDGYSHASAKAFCVSHNLPMALVANWYHLTYQPAATLIWGFAQTHELLTDQFDDIHRWEAQRSTSFALGRGRYCVPLDENNAGKLLATLTHH
jgi:hypothetical protein